MPPCFSALQLSFVYVSCLFSVRLLVCYCSRLFFALLVSSLPLLFFSLLFILLFFLLFVLFVCVFCYALPFLSLIFVCLFFSLILFCLLAWSSFLISALRVVSCFSFVFLYFLLALLLSVFRSLLLFSALIFSPWVSLFKLFVLLSLSFSVPRLCCDQCICRLPFVLFIFLSSCLRCLVILFFSLSFYFPCLFSSLICAFALPLIRYVRLFSFIWSRLCKYISAYMSIDICIYKYILSSLPCSSFRFSRYCLSCSLLFLPISVICIFFYLSAVLFSSSCCYMFLLLLFSSRICSFRRRRSTTTKHQTIQNHSRPSVSFPLPTNSVA